MRTYKKVTTVTVERKRFYFLLDLADTANIRNMMPLAMLLTPSEAEEIHLSDGGRYELYESMTEARQAIRYYKNN